jgi:hypothetical protein
VNDGKRQELKFTVGTDGEAHELTAAWREIIAGKLPRLNAAATDEDGIMERARVGLQRIVNAIEDHPGSGQSARLIKFLASACMDYLNYDRLGKAEVHTHLTGRGNSRHGLMTLGFYPNLTSIIGISRDIGCGRCPSASDEAPMNC